MKVFPVACVYHFYFDICLKTVICISTLKYICNSNFESSWGEGASKGKVPLCLFTSGSMPMTTPRIDTHKYCLLRHGPQKMTN